MRCQVSETQWMPFAPQVCVEHLSRSGRKQPAGIFASVERARSRVLIPLPVIPASWKLRQEDCHKFEARISYIAIYRRSMHLRTFFIAWLVFGLNLA